MQFENPKVLRFRLPKSAAKVAKIHNPAPDGYYYASEHFEANSVFCYGFGSFQVKPIEIISTIENKRFSITWQEIKSLNETYGTLLAETIYSPHDCCFTQKHRMVRLPNVPAQVDLDQFKELFEFNWEYFLNYKLLYFGVGSFDIISFDDFLIKKFGYNIDRDGSMKDFLIKRFPDKIESIIRCLGLTTK